MRGPWKAPSGAQYQWDCGGLPRYDDLPEIDQAGMDALLEQAVAMCATVGIVPKTFETGGGGGCGETSDLGLTVTPDLARQVMEILPNDGKITWDDWKTTGIALWNAVGPVEGWSIWDAWSRKNAAKYDASETSYTWERGVTRNNGTSGFGSLVWRARQAHGGTLPGDLEKHMDAARFARAVEGMPPVDHEEVYRLQTLALAVIPGVPIRNPTREQRRRSRRGAWTRWTIPSWNRRLSIRPLAIFVTT